MALSTVAHLVDDVLPVLRLPAMVRLCAPSTVLPLGQVLKRRHKLLVARRGRQQLIDF